jgi:Holliday junction resolvase-like predicted endonuclease
MDRPSPPAPANQRLKPREQGDLGELSAMEWLAGRGARLFIPVFHSPDIDLIAELDDQLLRIQVKTCVCRDRPGRWSVHIATRGGNQSWNGIVKYLDSSRCDYLFVLVGDGRRWFIPAQALEGRSGLSLGGPKYSEFEVEPGNPIIPPRASTIAASPRGSAGAGEPGRTVNSVAKPEWVRIPPPPSPSVRSELPAGPSARTRVSRNHQITIPLGPFRGAGLRVGEAIRVTADGDGQLRLDRIEMPADNPATIDAAQGWAASLE